MLFNISHPIKTRIEASSFNTAIIKFVKKYYRKNKLNIPSITITDDATTLIYNILFSGKKIVPHLVSFDNTTQAQSSYNMPTNIAHSN